ncbi:MAG: 50S ribosomal protein L18 [Acidobacteria bacterium]|nr:50S ribosomal protein L18 [Acidobacteriota bacterium]TDI45739.1 MAG: 50S ribosomal protein L18 [Acidobacteriota bacterium]
MANMTRKDTRRRIRYRIRRKVHGTAERPRLAVFRSIKHIYVQAIDDVAGRTLVHASSRDSEIKGEGNIEAAKKVGALVAQRLKDAGVEQVVFDRGGVLYHGRVRAIADAVRQAGLKI